MAVTIDRVMAKAAAALLPGLLPTPPRSTMIAPCVTIILPADFPKPGRADSVQRWDAHKNGKTCSPPASSRGSSTSSSSSSKSPGRGHADSVDRWGVNKTGSKSPFVPTSSYLKSHSSSKRPSSRASSADRWDAHKKPRPAPRRADAEDQTEEQEMEINETRKDETPAEMDVTVAPAGLSFSGPSYFVSPEPSMLPLPTFLVSH